MKTIDITPEEMQRYIARYDDLTPNKARTAGNIPPEAREMMTARETKTVIAHEGAKDTPWGDGPIPGPASFAVVIAECEPGNGPGLHVHQNTTETFTCIKGRFRIEWGDQGQHSTELNLFDTISVPPGVMRRFHNIGDESGLLYVILQGGERNLRDVEFAPSMVEELEARFGADVVRELENVGYTFRAGLD
ncbi:MAG: cupin domain-containing protein [Alphaproteobacteria bacterium]|nr:cupin domain-containing protein [Alphaproteobacteria bacterium]MCZ6841172.1 cupin domain-containing protein [Alphaproteobacteria bacterium]